MKKSQRILFDPDSSSMASSMVSSNLGALPRESLHQIRALAGGQATLRSSLASNNLREVMGTGSPQLLCLFVLKLLSRWSPETHAWEGSANRAAYWWAGQKGVIRGPSNKPPAEVSKRPGGPQVATFCMDESYNMRCLAFMRALVDYVASRWKAHLQRHAYRSESDIMIVFERPEDARSDRWDPRFYGNDCWRTGCCVAIVVPAHGRPEVTLAHASSLHRERKRYVLLSPTPYSRLGRKTAREYVNFFLDRGQTNASVRYISLWQDDHAETMPPLKGFTLFGAEFSLVGSTDAIPDQGGGIEEVPVRQFALAQLQLNVDLHAISVPYRPRS